MPRRSMSVHSTLLFVVLLAIVPVAGTDIAFSADEGAALAQADVLARDGEWGLEHPLPEVDPSGDAVPLANSEVLEGLRYVPYAKHPAYPVVLVPFVDAAGATGARVLSVVGTVLAAAAAAVLAARVRRGLAIPALWLTGLGTPLLFDSQLVMAHTLAAAACAWATVAVLHSLTSRRHSGAAAVVAAIAIAVAVLLRTEAVLYGGALALAALVGGRRAARPAGAVLAGAATAVAAGAAYLVDDRLEGWVVGDDRVGFSAGASPNEGVSFVAQRVRGFGVTWLLPGYGDLGVAEMATFASFLLLLVLAVKLRRRTLEAMDVTVLGGAAVLAAIVRLLFDPEPIPGLLLATPLTVFGFVLIDRRLAGDVAARTMLVTVSVFAFAVAATQYATGGSGEWGGRYFALLLPAAVALALGALAGRLDGTPSGTARPLLAILVLVTAAVSVLAISSLRDVRQANDQIVAAVEDAGARADPGDGGRPVIVTTAAVLPRLAWDRLDENRWLRADDAGHLASLLEALRGAGIEAVVFASRDDDDQAVAAAHATEDVDPPFAGWTIQVLEP